MISTANTTASDICVEMYALADDLDDAEQQSAEQSAGNRADTAEHGGGERLDAGHGAGRGDRASDTPSRAARPRQRQGRSRWRTSWRSSRLTLIPMSRAAPLSSEHGAHRLAHFGLAGEERERDHDDERTRRWSASATWRSTQLTAEEGNTRLAARRLKEVREAQPELEPQSSSAAFWRK